VSEYTELAKATTRVMGELDNLAHVYDAIDPVGDAMAEITDTLDRWIAESEAELARIKSEAADQREVMRSA
jgi:hypothetical protein